jgi:hypothetical protein
MANIFVAYDLISPGQNYEAVREKIKSLGRWYQAQYSLFYLSTGFSVEQVHSAVRSVMDANDKLAVIDANRVQMTPYPQSDINDIASAWGRAA